MFLTVAKRDTVDDVKTLRKVNNWKILSSQVGATDRIDQQEYGQIPESMAMNQVTTMTESNGYGWTCGHGPNLLTVRGHRPRHILHAFRLRNNRIFLSVSFRKVEWIKHLSSSQLWLISHRSPCTCKTGHACKIGNYLQIYQECDM